jgi:hypothetical protein
MHLLSSTIYSMILVSCGITAYHDNSKLYVDTYSIAINTFICMDQTLLYTVLQEIRTVYQCQLCLPHE